MAKGTQATILLVCEDEAHEAFIRAVLVALGVVTAHALDVKRPERFLYGETWSAQGSGKAFVDAQLGPLAKKWLGRRSAKCVIGVTDADQQAVSERISRLHEALTANSVDVHDSRLFLLVPRWEIENWAASLDGDQSVDENSRDALKLKGDKRLQAVRVAGQRFALLARSGALEGVPELPSLRRAIEEVCKRCALLRK